MFKTFGGGSFRINKLWEIGSFNCPAYLISYRTLYDVEISGTGGMSYLTSHSHENHTTIILKPSRFIPDLIVRPRVFRDFIADPFFRIGKNLKNNFRFNLKYVIEVEKDSEEIELLANQEINSKLLEQKHFWIEFLDNRITFHFQNGRTLKNFARTLEIAELFAKRTRI